MKIISFNQDVQFNEDKVATKVILESSFTKEIRILMKESQIMKEHKAPFPITVHVLKGSIDFGVQEEIHILNEGDIIALDGNVPHDLKANSDSIIRLTLSKLDRVERLDKLK